MRLPDDRALGGTSVDGSRPIASYDVTPVARANEALARTVEQVGNRQGQVASQAAAQTAEAWRGVASGIAKVGDAAVDYARVEKHTNDAFELTKAKSLFTTDKINLESKASTDTDYTTLPQRYGSDLTSSREKAAGLISDPRVREKFLLETSDDVARGNAAVNGIVFKKTADSEIAGAMDELKTIKDRGLSSADPSEKANLPRIGAERIAGLQAKGYITAETAQKWKQEWVSDYGEKWLGTLPAEERLKVLSPYAKTGDISDRIIGAESGGKASAKNPNSSATGAGQFIDGTWLSLIKSVRPDIAKGRDDATLLNLRNDPALSKQMVGEYAKQNAAYLQAQGVQVNDGAIYLAHFLGPEGAAKVLKADPGTPISELVGKKEIAANPQVLSGQTAGSVVGWAAGKVGGDARTGTPADFISQDKRVNGYRLAEQEVARTRNENSFERATQYDRQITDAAVGQATMPDRAAIASDPGLDEPRRNALLQKYDSATSDIVKLQAVMTKFGDPNGGAFNPYDTAEKKAVDSVYKALGGNVPALEAVVNRTGMLPASAAVGLRGDIGSNDPKRVAGALSVASNLLTKNQNIFAPVDGKADIEDNAVSFRHYVEDLGMTADDAAKRIIRDRSPEYQASVKAKIKAEDIDAKLKKEVSIGDLEKAFDQSYLPFTDPSIGFDPAQRLAMYGQYSELVKENYLSNGDMGLSKKLAGEQLKKTWGVTEVNGSKVVMQYPPEKSPAMAGIDNSAGLIAKQAITDIKTETGKDLERGKLKLSPVPGLTAQAFKAGMPAPYLLEWIDKEGITHMLNPGKAFVADPASMRNAQTAERQSGLERERKINELRQVKLDDPLLAPIPGMP